MERIKQIKERNERHRVLRNSSDILAVYEMKTIIDTTVEDKDYLLSLIDTQKKEIEEIRHYKNMYNGLFEGFQQNILQDPKDIT